MLCPGDEGEEVGVAFGMVEKAAVVGGAVLRHAVEMLAKAAVEALDHAVGLRPERLSEAVGDGVRGAGAVERVLAGGPLVGFGFLVDGEAVGELGAVVASTMSSSGRARLRGPSAHGLDPWGSSTIRASSQAVIGVARRCGRVERSATSGRAFQRATVRGWIPSSRASAAGEAVLCWI